MAEDKKGVSVNRDLSNSVAEEILKGKRQFTPETMDSDEKIRHTLKDAIAQAFAEEIEYVFEKAPQVMEPSEEFENRMDKFFRKLKRDVLVRNFVRKARPYLASAAVILLFCSVILFSVLLSGRLNGQVVPSKIPAAIDTPLSVLLPREPGNANYVTRYNDGYYVDRKGALSDVDDLLKKGAYPQEIPLYVNPIPRPFGSTAGIGLGYHELRSYSLRLADIISGSPDNRPEALHTEESTLYLRMEFEGYTLRASRYGYIDIIPALPQLYSLDERGIEAAINAFLEDYAVITTQAPDEKLTVIKGNGEGEYLLYFASADTVRNAINRDLHEVCVTLQNGYIESCRVKITDFLLEDEELKPALPLDHAFDRLLSDSQFEIESEEEIAAVDIVYLSGADFEFFYPAYRFYVELSPEEASSEGFEGETAQGLKVYRLIQIPAVELIYPNT